MAIITNIKKLSKILRGLNGKQKRIVFDFETSGVRPRIDHPVGLGCFIPSIDTRSYINIGHQIESKAIPLTPVDEVADLFRAIVSDSEFELIGHNVPFDLRFLFRIGIAPTDFKCRIIDTLIWTHRCDENYRADSMEPTTFDSTLTYGLKELNHALFGIEPLKMDEAVDGRNMMRADPEKVARYCVSDCECTWRLCERANEILDRDGALIKLVNTVDDPNNIVLSKMMWEGVLVNPAEADRQRVEYEGKIQQCRERIWGITKSRDAIETPNEVMAFMAKYVRITDAETDGERLYPFEDLAIEDMRGNRTILQRKCLKKDALLAAFDRCGDGGKEIIALFLAKWMMEQRIDAFLKPLPPKVALTNDRLYPDRFSSTLTSTRFSSTPNMQNLPSRSDNVDSDDLEEWQQLLPKELREPETTKNIFIAKPGYEFIAFDLSAAEPRYLAMIFQNAIRLRGADIRAKIRERTAIAKTKYAMTYAAMSSNQEPFEDDFAANTGIIWPDYDEDPLHAVFAAGGDPYNALAEAMMPNEYATATDKKHWLKNERWRAKKAFLALAYGSQAQTLYKPLQWTFEQTQLALNRLRDVYKTLAPLEALTIQEVFRTGEVRSLWGRPRRMNGYYQLAYPQSLIIGFGRKVRGKYQRYEAKVISLATYSRGVQTLIEDAYHVKGDGSRGRTVLQGNLDGTIRSVDKTDPFVTSPTFNKIPFRNIGFAQIQYAETIRKDGSRGLRHYLATEARARRQAFNARCQMSGADHLRWMMNNMDGALQREPKFVDVALVLTIHDSLLYEVPLGLREDFINMAMPILTQRPEWADIRFKVSVSYGSKYGEMVEPH